MVPHGMTAQRPSWVDLPADVKRQVDELCGAHVVTATACGGGFTPGFAAVVRCENGLQFFVKAAYADHAEWLQSAYRQEIAAQAKLNDFENIAQQSFSPRLVASYDRGGVVVLCYEAITAGSVARPWNVDQAGQGLELLERLARVRVPAGTSLGLVCRGLIP